MSACARHYTTVCIHEKDFGEAIKRCDEVEVMAPRNIKNMLRRARARRCRGHFDAAEADLARVTELDHFNEEAQVCSTGSTAICDTQVTRPTQVRLFARTNRMSVYLPG